MSDPQNPLRWSCLAADAFREVRLLKQPWRLRETLQNLEVFQTSRGTGTGWEGLGIVGG